MNRSAPGRPHGRGHAAPRTGGTVPGPPAALRHPSPAAGRRGRPDPRVDDDVTSDQLPEEVRRELRSLPAALADRVAGHLVMAGRLLEEDPTTAHEHSLAARGLAARLAAVREVVGVTAYRAGRYAEALGEFRAVLRMTGAADYLPMMADCERGLGRPERALALAENPQVPRLDRAGQVEMRIVCAGARRDLGQLEAALMTLRAGTDLDPPTVEEWTPRLWYAYADTLLAAGQADAAREWFLAVAGVDEDGVTDAQERLAVLEAGLPAPDVTGAASPDPAGSEGRPDRSSG